MKRLALHLFFLSLFLSTYSQAPSKFFTRWGGGGHDVGYSVIQTLNGQYAVTGSTSSFGNGNTDVYLAIVDSMGWLRYQTSFGGFNNDIGQSIIQLADSGFVIAGYTNSFGSGGYDVYVVRTDKNCSLVWQQTIGGMDWDFGYKVLESPDGGFVICGSTQSYGYGKTDGYIVKLNSGGVFQWQKTYGGAEDDNFKSFVMTYNNMMAFAGTTKSMGDVKGDCWLFKTDLSGDSLLAVKYGDGKKQFINDIKEHPVTKNFYLCGADDKSGKDTTSAYLLGLDENGSFLFEDFHSYKEINDEQYVSLAYSKNSEFIYSRKNVHFPGANRGLEPMISLYANQFYINATTCGSPDDDELHHVIKTKDKGFAFIGYTHGYSASSADFFLYKLDSASLSGGVDVIGIQETNTNLNHFRVYPTVCDDFINVRGENDKSSHCIIFNSVGQKILEENFVNASQIDISSFAESIYFVKLFNKTSAASFKIIKRKKSD